MWNDLQIVTLYCFPAHSFTVRVKYHRSLQLSLQMQQAAFYKVIKPWQTHCTLPFQDRTTADCLFLANTAEHLAWAKYFPHELMKNQTVLTRERILDLHLPEARLMSADIFLSAKFVNSQNLLHINFINWVHVRVVTLPTTKSINDRTSYEYENMDQANLYQHECYFCQKQGWKSYDMQPRLHIKPMCII